MASRATSSMVGSTPPMWQSLPHSPVQRPRVEARSKQSMTEEPRMYVRPKSLNRQEDRGMEAAAATPCKSDPAILHPFLVIAVTPPGATVHLIPIFTVPLEWGRQHRGLCNLFLLIDAETRAVPSSGAETGSRNHSSSSLGSCLFPPDTRD